MLTFDTTFYFSKFLFHQSISLPKCFTEKQLFLTQIMIQKAKFDIP